MYLPYYKETYICYITNENIYYLMNTFINFLFILRLKKRKLSKKCTERLQAGNYKFIENLIELDPFDVYDRYIKWTMANYSQASGSHSRLLQLLESASYRFVNDIRYKNDPRYLRCWIQYSKHVENFSRS